MTTRHIIHRTTEAQFQRKGFGWSKEIGVEGSIIWSIIRLAGGRVISKRVYADASAYNRRTAAQMIRSARREVLHEPLAAPKS